MEGIRMSGAFHIESNITTTELRARDIEETTSPLIIPNLSTTDTQSTISANENSKIAYAYAQSKSATMSGRLELAVNNIRAVAESFENWDNGQ